MIGRFMRAYPAYTAEAVLYMPVQRFWALYKAIQALDASDDLRALMVAGHGANPGKDGQAFGQMARTLRAQVDGRSAAEAQMLAAKPVLPGLTPGVTAAEPGSLRAERLAKLAAFEAERQAHYAE